MFASSEFEWLGEKIMKMKMYKLEIFKQVEYLGELFYE